MTIIQKINNFVKKKYNLFSIISPKTLRLKNFNPVVLITFVIIFFGVYFISSSFINKKNKENLSNLNEIFETNEFSNLANFFFILVPARIMKFLSISKNINPH